MKVTRRRLLNNASVIRLQPGDVLHFHIDGDMEPPDVEWFRRQVERSGISRDHILVTCGNVETSVVRQEVNA